MDPSGNSNTNPNSFVKNVPSGGIRMNLLAGFFEHHWRSIALVLGACLATFYVYKNRSKLMR
jgi:hypothetical protein